jgi:hypothetical protein
MEKCCQICYEDFGTKDQQKIDCTYCDVECCVGCIKTHILSLPNDPACPSCKNIWKMQFCTYYLTKKFMNNDYKNSRIEMIFKAEQNKVSKTLNDVQNLIESESYDQKIIESKDEVKIIQSLLWAKKVELRNMREKQKNLKKPNYTKKNEYKMKCPNDKCSGFLKNDYVCILCEMKYCSDCLEDIGIKPNNGGESKTQPHQCKPDLVATVTMIKKESKPCPGCSELISKINGCDQMWCIKCRIAFSWDTGNIDYSKNHNPHYIEWRKQNGRANTRQPGEILCGGIPDYKILKRLLECAEYTTNAACSRPMWQSSLGFHKIPEFCRDNKKMINLPIFKNTINQERFFHWFCEMSQSIENFRTGWLDWHREDALKEDITREIRIKFIRKQINEETFKKKIYKLTMKNKKNIEILHIFELCYVVSVEQFNEIFQIILKLNDDLCSKYKNDYYKVCVGEIGKKQTLYNFKNYRLNMWLKFYPKIVECIENLENILTFCNNQLYEIAKKYKTMTSFIGDKFTIFSWTVKNNWKVYPFQNKKFTLQKIQRTPYNGEHWPKWQKDKIPIKEMFDDNIFEKKIKIKADGTWYVVHPDETRTPPPVLATVPQGGIIV